MTDEQPDNSNLTAGLAVVSIFPRLATLGFSDRDMRSLFERTEFAALHSRSRQVCFLADDTANILQRSLKTRELAQVFEVTERTVERILQRGPRDQSSPGAHRTLDDDTERGLVQMLIDRFHRGGALTDKELLKIIRE
jgi:hypothetical protein